MAADGLADAGELKTVQEQGKFGGGADSLLDLGLHGMGNQGEDLRDRGCETLLRAFGVGCVEEAGAEIAGVGGVALGEVFGALVEFVELPACGVGAEPGEAGEGDDCGARGNDEAEALKKAFAAGAFAAELEPEDADGEDAVDGCGRFFGVDGDDGPGLLAFVKNAAGVGGAEGFFQVHGGLEGVGFEVRKVFVEDAFEEGEILFADRLADAGGAAVGLGDEFEGLRFGLAEAEVLELEDVVAEAGADDAADEVAVVAPELEGAAVGWSCREYFAFWRSKRMRPSS